MSQSSHHRKKKSSKFLHHTKTIFLFGIGSFFLVAGILVLWASSVKLPDFSEFNDRKVVESTKIYDRTDKILLYDVHQDVKRTIIPITDISQNLKNAVVAIEDSGFYQHGPISISGLARAVLYGGTRGGGSTITQQVIKNTLLTDEKLITRKFKEIVLSFKLEQAFSKDDILGLYLNEIPYGGNVYGIGEASNLFFGKAPKDLDIAESAYLAAIPNAPTYYSPYGNHRDKLDERKNLVLLRMRDLKMISDTEYAAAQAEKVAFLAKEPQGIKAPHFVEWVKEYLADKYGETAVEENGYHVVTTLDYDLQQKAEAVVASYGPTLQKNFNASNMGLVAIDPTNGQVLAMVGSRDYFDVANQGNFNVTLTHRQPGSTFKPFVYATLFEKGYTPDTTLFDLKTNFSTNCDANGVPLTPNIKPEDCYVPENFDGNFRGPISIRNALAQSLNVPAVKSLYLAGINDSLTTARRMGIQDLGDANQYGLTLVLGGGEVTPLDLTGAYGVFANDGVRNPTVSILRIEDKDGNIIEQFTPHSEKIIPSEVARQITSILSDDVARTPEFGPHSALYFPGRDVAVKTGTTNDYRDVWTVGYTPNIAVGMWAGNNDNSPMAKNIAGLIITPVWHAFMAEALKITPTENFIPPQKVDETVLPAPLQGIWQGGEKYVIDRSSGKLATSLTPTEMRGTIVVPDVHTILHWVDKNNPLGPPPATPENDPQYNLWEAPVRAWVTAQNFKEGDRSAIPTEYETNHTVENTPIVSLSGSDFSIYHNPSDLISVSVSATSVFPIDKVEFYVNNQLVGKKVEVPYTFSFTPSNIDSLSSKNTITAVVYDSVLNKGVLTTQLLINQ